MSLEVGSKEENETPDGRLLPSSGARKISRIAVVGADPHGRGFGARAHVAAVLGTPGLRLAAVCTSREETAVASAAAFGADRWYADYEQLMQDSEVDVVTIAVRVRLHAKIAEAALEAGKPVYCEWPLCLTSTEARRLGELARKRSVPTAVGLQARFAPSARYARQLVSEGAIGRPLSFVSTQLLGRFDVVSSRSWLALEDEGSGALHVATGHAVDLVESLLGRIDAIAGARATMLPQGEFTDTCEPFTWTASDVVAFTARLTTGCVGSFYTTYLAQEPGRYELHLFGDEGELTLRAPGYVSYAPSTLLIKHAGRSVAEAVSVPDAFRQGVDLEENEVGFNVAHALFGLVGAVLGQADFHPGFEDAVHVHQVLEHVQRSDLRSIHAW